MFAPIPVSQLQVELFWILSLLLIGGVISVAWRNRGQRVTTVRRERSRIGILLQSLGCAAAGFGPVHATLASGSTAAVLGAAGVVLLAGGAFLLFVSAARAMGGNWSLVARTRSDHELIRTGPFAWVRHPIYLAILLYLFAIAVGLGHFVQLLIALPLFAAGTIIRIRDEEALLRAQFGGAHANYVREVAAIIPKIY